MVALLGLSNLGMQARELVAYFSAQGHTLAIAEEIARVRNADILRIEAANPYATNPYDDSDRIQNEAYDDLRPEVANLPDAETMEQYDTIFVGSPIWWHQPTMVVCTFLESYDLSGKTIIPFFTYGATTYLNESMQKIYRVTPNSIHIPATLPEDLNPDDITTPGPSDDVGIDMPRNSADVEYWLQRLGLTDDNGTIETVVAEDQPPFEVYNSGGIEQVNISESWANNSLDVYSLSGMLLFHEENSMGYIFAYRKGRSI